jgi:hypothetical protein
MVQNTWKLPDISSLHNVDRTGINSLEMMQTFISSKGYDLNHPISPPIQARGLSAIVGRPVWSAAA